MNKQMSKKVAEVKKMVMEKKAGMKMPTVKLPKLSKKQKMIAAGAVAGVTLLGTIAGYSIYFVKNRQKKVNFKNMKIEVLKHAKLAHSKAMPMANKAGKALVKSAKSAHKQAMPFAKKAHSSMMNTVNTFKAKLA